MNVEDDPNLAQETLFLNTIGYKHDHYRMTKRSDCLSLRLPHRLRCCPCDNHLIRMMKLNENANRYSTHECEKPDNNSTNLNYKKDYKDKINLFLVSGNLYSSWHSNYGTCTKCFMKDGYFSITLELDSPFTSYFLYFFL